MAGKKSIIGSGMGGSMAERGDWLRFLEQSVWEEARKQNPDGTLWGREEVVEFVFDPTGHGKGLNV